MNDQAVPQLDFKLQRCLLFDKNPWDAFSSNKQDIFSSSNLTYQG